jgi:hypothetical protein
MPQTSFYLFLQSIVNFLIRLVLGIFSFLQWICYLSPLPDWMDWGLIGLLIIVIVLVIFLARPGEK